MEGSVDVEAAFGALSDPTRVDILRVLAERRMDDPASTEMSFSELRKGVDVRDSGRFLYHLEKLLGVFVEKTGAGTYRLTVAGEQVTTAIAAGLFTGRVALGPTALDSDCPVCGTTAVGRFEDGLLSVTCGEDHALLVWRFPPNAAAEATVPELAALATMRVRHEVESALTGACGACHGSVSTRAEATEESPVPARFRSECGTCGSRLDGPLWYALLAHPEAVAFYQRHGRSVRGTYLWEFEAELRETPFPGEADGRPGVDDPPDGYHVAVPLDDETLHALLDGSAHVVRTMTAERSRPAADEE